MPELNIQIGGRDFLVACNEGEEPHLRAAAAVLDDQASELQGHIGRLPEARLLLMAGLMLADRFKDLDAEAQDARANIAKLESRLRDADAKLKLSETAREQAEKQARGFGATGTEEEVRALENEVARLEDLAEQLAGDDA